MGQRVIWIDSAVADFHEESVFIVETSGGQDFPRRMSRAAFRQFIEASVRMLNAEDRHDQEGQARIGKSHEHD